MKEPLLIASACLLALLASTGASLPYPILPPLFAGGEPSDLTHFLGLPPKLLLGVALMINPLGLLIGSATIGPLSDRFGRRRVLLVSVSGAAAGHAATAVALVLESYPLFLLSRFATGLLEGQGPVLRAMLVERLRGGIRNHALSWLNGSFNLGWLVGPVLAGLTVGLGTTVPFYLAAGTLLLGGTMVAAALRGETGGGGTEAWWIVARERHSFNLLRHDGLRTLFTVQLAYTCGVAAFYQFYPLWLVEVGDYDAPAIALVNVGLCGLMICGAAVAGRASRHHPLLRASWFAGIAAFAVAAVALGNLWVGLFGIFLFGVPHAFYSAVIQAWSADRFGEHGQGAVMGLLSTTFCLANILMAGAGALLTLVDTRIVLLLGALLGLWAGRRIGRWRRQGGPATQGGEA